MVNTEEHAHIATEKPSLEQWHCRFGHLNFSYINKLAQGNLVEGTTHSSGTVNQECEAVCPSKDAQNSFPKERYKESKSSS